MKITETLLNQYREATGSKAADASIRKMGYAKIAKKIAEAQGTNEEKTTEEAKVGSSIREIAEHYILTSSELSYQEILDAVKAHWPEAKTSLNCLRWYASKLRARGIEVPTRRRAANKK